MTFDVLFNLNCLIIAQYEWILLLNVSNIEIIQDKQNKALAIAQF